jgi:hypothetical protein
MALKSSVATGECCFVGRLGRDDAAKIGREVTIEATRCVVVNTRRWGGGGEVAVNDGEGDDERASVGERALMV